jgi:hypothetical protein
MCRFHVAAGAKLRPGRGAIYKLPGAVAKLASINLRNLVLSPTGSINLGFILREDLLLCSSYLPLGVPNWADIYTPSVDYSLFMTAMMMFTSEWVEKRLGVTLAVFPPPISTGIASVSMFRVSPLPRFAVFKGGIYIGTFRSS